MVTDIGQSKEVLATRTIGLWVIGFAFFMGILITLSAAWVVPDLVLFLPGLIVGVVLIGILFSQPVANLTILLSCFVFISNADTGLQPLEAVYIVYFLAYLGWWSLTAKSNQGNSSYFYPERSLVIFLIWIFTASIWLGVIFQSNLRIAASEAIWFVLFGLFFPLRHFVSRRDHGATIVLGVFCFWGIFAALRNFVNYREVLINATYSWQIARGRVHVDETLLLMAALALLVIYSMQTGKQQNWLLITGFFAVAGALILTQGRGYWIDFIFGVAILFAVSGRLARRKLLSLFSVSALIVFVIAYLAMGNTVFLLLSGLYERLISVGTAFTDDVSMINRYFENREVWTLILKNPVLGYGFGVEYQVFDIIADVTLKKAFVHNGFLAIWYKFGLVGLVSILVFWGGSVHSAYQVYRKDDATHADRTAALFVFIALLSLLPAAAINSPFMFSDGLLTFTLLGGMASGLRVKSMGTNAAE